MRDRFEKRVTRMPIAVVDRGDRLPHLWLFDFEKLDAHFLCARLNEGIYLSSESLNTVSFPIP